MSGFLSFRVIPGVRVKLSSRGVRAGIGPRAARLHVGGGRPGVSSGAGPFTAYQPIGKPRRARTSPPSAGQTAAGIFAAVLILATLGCCGIAAIFGGR